jgi:hypothetical protein
VRSVVQFYPGPFCYLIAPRAFRRSRGRHFCDLVPPRCPLSVGLRLRGDAGLPGPAASKPHRPSDSRSGPSAGFSSLPAHRGPLSGACFIPVANCRRRLCQPRPGSAGSFAKACPRLVSVRSIVQLYPGSFFEPIAPGVMRFLLVRPVSRGAGHASLLPRAAPVPPSSRARPTLG